MALVGDSERERTVASLRRHFVEGRLSVEDLGARAELALGARSRAELRTALRDLQPPWQDGVDRLATTARRGLRLAALGTALGLAGAFGVNRLLSRLLYETSPHDPAVLIATALLLAGVAAAASWLPARRAARLDPGIALREE